MKAALPGWWLFWALTAGAVHAADSRPTRLDHRGAVGGFVALGGQYVSILNGGRIVEDGLRVPVTVGFSVAPFESGHELLLAARGSFLNARPSWAVWAGYRIFFGQENWKTFLDLGLVSVVRPLFSIGPRIGFGVLYDFVPEVGVYAAAAAEVGGGAGFRFGADVGIGLQVRTYWLD
ncbi:MAG: hypothetical protein ACKVPX_08680 [Myxococcaceae bacterium]